MASKKSSTKKSTVGTATVKSKPENVTDSETIQTLADTPQYLAAYSPKTWVNGETIYDTDLNHIEQGIADIAELDISASGVYCGTCSTVYNISGKVVECSDFKLVAGAAILVTFSNYSQTSRVGLNVNSTGTYYVYLDGGTSGFLRWAEKTTILFVYDGAYWIPVGFRGTYYGESSTAASTTVKTASIREYILAVGVQVTIQFSNANTDSSPNLNISSTGSYPIKGNVEWSAGDYVTFTFDGTNYVIQEDATAQSTADSAASAASAAQSTADSAASAASAAQSTADKGIQGININGKSATIADHVAEIEMANGVYFGESTTSAGTAAKIVKCSTFTEVADGAVLYVYFENASMSDEPTLNVNSTGAQTIRVSNDKASSTNPFKWGNETCVLFVYESGMWDVYGVQEIFYCKCTTAAGTAGKSATIDSFVLRKGTQVTINFTSANTADSPTINISGIGAYPVVGNTNWSAGDYVTFVFDGTNYVIQEDAAAQNTANEALEKAQAVEDSAITGITINGDEASINNHIAELDIGSGVYYAEFDDGEISCPDFKELFDGAAVYIYFARGYSEEDLLTLNVNGTGEKPVIINGNEVSKTNHFRGFASGSGILFIYSNGGWYPIGIDDVYYASCTSPAEQSLKSINCDYFILRQGVQLTVLFENGNTNESPVFLVGYVGSFSVVGDTNWSAGDYVTFVFDGENYVVQSADSGGGSEPTYDADTETLIF